MRKKDMCWKNVCGTEPIENARGAGRCGEASSDTTEEKLSCGQDRRMIRKDRSSKECVQYRGVQVRRIFQR